MKTKEWWVKDKPVFSPLYKYLTVLLNETEKAHTLAFNIYYIKLFDYPPFVPSEKYSLCCVSKD